MNTFVLMAGPQSSYKDNLKELTKRYNLTNNFFWSDIILKDMKWGAISASEAMVLSSHGENFGISLVESLSVSVPVITTDKVNISNEILNSGAGLISKNTVSGFSNNLLKFIQFNKKQKLYMSQQALKCFENNFDISSNKKTLSNILLKK